MKRWLPRSLWLLAWAFWVWLGFGLYRELPRRASDPLPVSLSGPSEILLDSIRGEDLLVTLQESHDLVRLYRLIDARTGRLVQQVTGPWFNGLIEPIHHHGVVVGFDGDRPRADAKATPYVAVDLRTGAQRELDADTTNILDIHRRQPWVLARTGRGGQTRLTVFDFRDGVRVGEWHAPAPPNGFGEKLLAAYFLEAVDELLIHLERDKGGDGPPEQRLVRSTIEVTKPRVLRADKADHAFVTKPVANGRCTWETVEGDQGVFAVIDARDGATLFSQSSSPLLREFPLWRLSGQGESLLILLRYLDTVLEGRTLWSQAPVGESALFSRFPNCFCVEEEWPQRFGCAVFPVLLRTVAFREMESGALLFRTLEGKDAKMGWSSDARFCWDSNGVVYRLPLVVNYSLLAICQSLLALPLIMLWAILRWRRKRRLRLPSVQQ
jgi:hypothetical protein